MIGIICIIDLNYIPYLNKYTELLDQLGKEYEIVYWKRSDDNKVYNFNTVAFDLPTDLKIKKRKKIRQLFMFRNFVKKQIKCKKYSKLIILSTLMGVLIFDQLLVKYKGKYIFDIRDYTYEWFKPYYYIESMLIKKAKNVVISSNGFRKFLPKNVEYVLCHNFNKKDIDINRKFNKKTELPLELTFIGAVRHFRIDKEIVDAFSIDSRFQLVYHGYGATYDALADYCIGKKVLLTGKYDNLEKSRFMDNVDIINSYYDGKKRANQYAISNKFYDAAIYKKPLWVNPSLYIGELTAEKGIGIICDLNPEEMYKAYQNIIPEEFEDNCNKLIKEILNDEKLFSNCINHFLCD